MEQKKLTVRTYCVMCGKKMRYTLPDTGRVKLHCSIVCVKNLHKIRLKRLGLTTHEVKKRSRLRLDAWRETQEKLLTQWRNP